MKSISIVIACAVLAIIQASPASIKYRKRRSADVSHVDPSVNLSIRSASDGIFPETLAAILSFEDGREIALNLVKNNKLALDAPEDDQDMVAFYTEETMKGSFVVKARVDEEEVSYSMEGVVFIDGQHMVVQQDQEGVLRVKVAVREHAQDGSSNDDDETVTEPRDGNVRYDEDTPLGRMSVEEKHEKKEGNGSGRSKRSTPGETQFDVETIFVIDHTIYDYWMSILQNSAQVEYQIRYMYTNYMNSMQLAYASIDESLYGIRITPRLSDIVILKTVAESTLSVNSINGYKASSGSCVDPYDCIIGDAGAFLLNVAQWKSDKGYTWNNPDHLMVFTMYDIKDTSTVGYAPVGEVCKGFNNIGFRGGISVVEDIGFATWPVMSHELGHNLGSPHDQTSQCPSSLQYLMAPSSSSLSASTVDNFHSFSSCSINSMKETLLGTSSGSFSNPKACLQDNKYSSRVFRSTAQLLGETMSLDDQCKTAKGQEYSYYNDGSVDGFCKTLKCRIGSSYSWSSLMAADGTQCGSGGAMWCIQGHCVTKTAIQYEASPSSTFTCSNPPAGCADNAGFSAQFNGESLTCNDVEANYPNMCWEYATYRDSCKATCHRVMCDSTEESPCSASSSTGTDATAPGGESSGDGCKDVAGMILNGMPCLDFCASIDSSGLLDAYRNSWPATCQYCCNSCKC